MIDSQPQHPHHNRDRCLALFGQRVKVTHSTLGVVEGRVMGYDPRPLKMSSGDYLVIRPDKSSGDVCYPLWVTVRYDSLLKDGTPTAAEMMNRRCVAAGAN